MGDDARCGVRLMLLALSVVSEQGAALGNAAYKIFDERGGSIGRVSGNDWVLPDPQNFVSSRHARVSASAGMFFLEDTSSNGTFINAPDRLTARGEPQQLVDGDRLYIGDYEIIVQLIPSAPGEIAARAPAATMSEAPTRLQVPAAARASAPPAATVASATSASQAAPAAIESERRAASLIAPTPVPQAAPLMPPPSVLGLDTVDPLAALGSAPSVADPLVALGDVAARGSAGSPFPPALARDPVSDPLAALEGGAPGPLAALGVEASHLDPDVQAAVLTGLRAGFNALLTSLHPEQLEDLYERKLKRSAMLGLGSKAKYWEMYRAQFEEIDRDREAHFRQLFGDEFARACNEHLQRLAAAARPRGPR
jgi:type VI secretion system FHA domain protein